MTLPFTLSSPIRNGPVPQWTNRGFYVGNTRVLVLEYSSNCEGWNDDLTQLHEDAAGEHHFIDLASRNEALRQIQMHSPNHSPVILEVGCSSGFMLHLLQEQLPHAHIIGSDVILAPLAKLAKQLPKIPLLRFDLLQCPLPDCSIDTVVMLNVLEHISDDLKALKEVYRILKPGGIAVIEVPAGPHLYDAYDAALKHFRRYSRSSLCALAKAANFNILKKSHLGCLIYPGFWLVKKRNRRFHSSNEDVKQALVSQNIQQTAGNPFLKAIMKCEVALGRLLSYPFGIRCLLTCKKPI